MTIEELQKKIYSFSTSYFLSDLREDKHFFYNIPIEEMLKYPVCFSGYILNLYMDGELNKANEALKLLPENSLVRLGLEIANPTITWNKFYKILNYYKKNNITLQMLVLTAGRPYLINGFNDFSRTMPLLKGRKKLFIETLDVLYGKDCSSTIYNLLQAESYYQQNKLTDAELILSQTIKEFDKKNEYRLLFTALYLEAKIFIANGTTITTKQFISDIKKRVAILGKAEFSNNINAVQVQFSLYKEDYNFISEWMISDAPDEISDFNMLDLYRYMIKIRCYIMEEKYNPAISLIEKLRPLLIQGRRHTDLCELDLLFSIILYKSNKKELAFNALERALKIAKRLGFHRIISDEGTAIFNILIDYTKEKDNSPYLYSLIESTRRMAILYPQYLKPRYKNDEQFTQQEVDILNLLQQGKTLEEIGEYFFISLNTVKYHLKKLYIKLNAKNSNQAIWNARLLGLIQ